MRSSFVLDVKVDNISQEKSKHGLVNVSMSGQTRIN